MWNATRSRTAATLLLALVALGVGTLAGCDPGEGDPPTGEAFEGMAVAETDNPAMPVIAVHEDGEVVGTLADPATGAITGAVFQAQGLPALVVSLDPAGMPTRLVVDDWVVVFSDVQADRADLVVIAPDGAMQVARDVPYDLDGARATLAQAYARVSDPQLTLGDIFRYTMLGVSVPACTIGAALSAEAILVTGGLAGPVALAVTGGCLSALRSAIEIYRQQNPTSDDRIRQTSGAVAGVALSFNIAGCASAGDVLACVRAVMGTVEVLYNAGRITLELRQQYLLEAALILQGGGGAIQIQLNWNNSADLDLWVTEPSGERIWYGHPTSATGGRLDVDDTDGRGPENVFWPAGQAPHGQYIIEVDHYSGAVESTYRINTIIGGSVRLPYEGTVSPNETRRVYVLDYRGGGLAPPAPPTARAVSAPRPALASSPRLPKSG